MSLLVISSGRSALLRLLQTKGAYYEESTNYNMVFFIFMFSMPFG